MALRSGAAASPGAVVCQEGFGLVSAGLGGFGAGVLELSAGSQLQLTRLQLISQTAVVRLRTCGVSQLPLPSSGDGPRICRHDALS